MDRIIAKLKWEPHEELTELDYYTGYRGKNIYALTRNYNNSYIISYIGQTKTSVTNEIRQQSRRREVTGFQIVNIEINNGNGNLNPDRLTLIETALIHYTRKKHGWARMNINQTCPPEKDIRIYNVGHKHPKLHKRFDIIEGEIMI